MDCQLPEKYGEDSQISAISSNSAIAIWGFVNHGWLLVFSSWFPEKDGIGGRVIGRSEVFLERLRLYRILGLISRGLSSSLSE